jgi:hypothetical protein
MNLIALRTATKGAAIPATAVQQALDHHLRMLDERNVDVRLISATDDILATIESFDFLSEAQKLDMVHNNPVRAFPPLAGNAGL